jgi:formylglycine-generating enzyme required for sulfatase activity
MGNRLNKTILFSILGLSGFFSTSISPPLYSAEAKHFTLQFDSNEWGDIGNPHHFKSDLIILKDGKKIWGEINKIPDLSYPFGAVSFSPIEVAGISFSSDSKNPKMQVVTRNGQNFIGTYMHRKINLQQLIEVKEMKGEKEVVREEYIDKEVDLSDVNFILLKQRHKVPPLLHDRAFSVVLKGGDRFPVTIDRYQISLSDGANEFKIRSEDIVDVYYRDGLKGYLKGEGLNTPLAFSYVNDKSLHVTLLKGDQKLNIPWGEIDRVFGDRGSFILSTPYLFRKWIPEDMVMVPEGEFNLGDPSSLNERNYFVDGEKNNYPNKNLDGKALYERYSQSLAKNNSNEGPSVRVKVPAFYIDKYEVTNLEYQQFIQSTGHRPPAHWKNGRIPQGRERHPVVNVSYRDAVAYADWAGKRLPTEVEWERAAKGASGFRYPYGKTYDPQVQNTEGETTKRVGSFKGAVTAVDHGKGHKVLEDLEDMSGNVAEWTDTPYHANQYELLKKMGANKNPRGFLPSPYRTVRGGSFASSAATATTTHRAPLHEEDYNEQTGFRCAMDLPVQAR